MSRVLVTGGAGFLAGHVILQLVAAGHEVTATVRAAGRAPAVRDALAEAGLPRDAALSFAVADLTADRGWDEAVEGCEFVLHVASPFPATAPKREEELIVPARDGTLRVLRAASRAGVRRVVMTSSFAAVGNGHPAAKTRFDESDWTDVEAPGLAAYVRSKTIAERAAWDFVAAQDAGPALSVVNPVGIFGPTLGTGLSASTRIVRSLLDGAIAACPRVYFGMVDVRDVADLHLRAMSHPSAAGQRFLAAAGPCVSLLDVAKMLHRHLGERADKAPRRQMPDWLLRLASLWSDAARQALPNLGRVRDASNAKARGLLGWAPRPGEEAVLATARSLLHAG